MSVEIIGVLERIVFSSDENHFTIGKLKMEANAGSVTVKGQLPGIQCGETLSVKGRWEQHSKHGKYFKIESFESTLPANIYGIRKYLGSGLIPNIGPKYAEKIVGHFGKNTLKIISEESARLFEVPGIGKKRIEKIRSSWEEQTALRSVMMFLQTYGIGMALCVKLTQKYGNYAKEILQQEPYRVAREIPGIGFKTADRIALNLGFSNESDSRIEAGVLFALQDAESEGHTICTMAELSSRTAQMLELNVSLIKPGIENLIEREHLMAIESDAGTSLQLPKLHRAEMRIAYHLNQLASAPSSLPEINIDGAMQWAQSRIQLEFSEQQDRAIRMALKHKFSLLTGGPGTGKTTILRTLVDILRAKKVEVLLAAPTGRAAQKLAESTSMQAQTIHRLLKFDPNESCFVHDSENPLPGEFIIIDESSMLDTRLAAALFRAITPKAHLLLVGDADQLPSVSSGQVLADLITLAEHSENMNLIRLDRIFRQSERSNIVSVAYEILKGNSSLLDIADSFEAVNPSEDFHFLDTPNAEACNRCVLELCKNRLPEWYEDLNVFDSVQILAPMHRGYGGVTVLNESLQAALNPRDDGLQVGPTRFQLGDKVIQGRNNYEKAIFNGDLGRVCSIDGNELEVNFEGRRVQLSRGELGSLSLAYAISIHKSQGSEFPIVIVPLLQQHFVMLQRKLIYTAVTRGRQKVFVVGDPKAYAMAVRNQKNTRRLTDLVRKFGENQ